MPICDFGCGKESNYMLSNGKQCCEDNWRKCSAVRKKNSEGLKRAYREGRKVCKIPKEKRTWMKGRNAYMDPRIRAKFKPEEVFIENSKVGSGQVRKILMQQPGFKYRCEECGLTDWRGHSISLDLHHKNGDSKDHRRDNLQFLCPNCHAITKTYKSKNRNMTGTIKVSDDTLIDAIKRNKNMRSVLIDVGLAPKGGNYTRVKELIVKHKLSFLSKEDKNKLDS